MTDSASVDRAITDIKALYGLSTDIGDSLLRNLIYDMGFAALTDDAIIELARRHRDEEARQVNEALRSAKKNDPELHELYDVWKGR